MGELPGPTCELDGTNHHRHELGMRELETNVRNRVCRATIEHGLRQLAAARGAKSDLQNAMGPKL